MGADRKKTLKAFARQATQNEFIRVQGAHKLLLKAVLWSGDIDADPWRSNLPGVAPVQRSPSNVISPFTIV